MLNRVYLNIKLVSKSLAHDLRKLAPGLERTAVKVPGRNTVVRTEMMRIAALSRVAANAIRFWSSEIVFNAKLSLMLRALSFWAIKLYIYGVFVSGILGESTKRHALFALDLGFACKGTLLGKA